MQDTKLPRGTANRNSVLRDYRNRARARGLAYDLDDDEAIRLFESNCWYCGSSPSQVRSKPNSNGPYVFNGIDRVDNAQGYVKGNVVACCSTCNMMKKVLPIGQFIEQAGAIASHSSSVGAGAQEFHSFCLDLYADCNDLAPLDVHG